MLGAILGAVGSLFGGGGTSGASDAMADAAREQTELQREMFDRTDELQGGLYRQQRRTINRGTRRNIADADRTEGRELGLADRLRSRGMRDAGTAHDRNVRMFGREMDRGTNALRGAAGKNIGLYRRERERALNPFRVQSRLGNNALQAYASNLGVGAAPEGYSLEMTPGSQFLMDKMMEGVEGSAAAGGGLYSGATMAELQKEGAGIAALDRDAQQQQLFSLGGLGQTAAGAMADIRGGAADDIAGTRARGAEGVNALRSGYTGAIAGARDDLFSRRYGINSDHANMTTAAIDTAAGRRIGARDLRTANLGAARTNRANLFGSAATNYAAGGANALGNLGMAQAVGHIGRGNAWGNALQGIAGAIGEGGFKLPWMTGGTTPLPTTFGAGGQGGLY